MEAADVDVMMVVMGGSCKAEKAEEAADVDVMMVVMGGSCKAEKAEEAAQLTKNHRHQRQKRKFHTRPDLAKLRTASVHKWLWYKSVL